jgi:hypothetical protein
MSAEWALESLVDALQAVDRLIEDRGGHGLIIGGVAVGLISVPRFTADVDAVLLCDTAAVSSLLEAAERQGLTPRVADPEQFARATRMLLLHRRAPRPRPRSC